MARRRLMSEALREDLARDLGVHDIVARYGWGAVPARECGRLVQQAVLRAEALLAQQVAPGGGAPTAAGQPPRAGRQVTAPLGPRLDSAWPGPAHSMGAPAAVGPRPVPGGSATGGAGPVPVPAGPVPGTAWPGLATGRHAPIPVPAGTGTGWSSGRRRPALPATTPLGGPAWV